MTTKQEKPLIINDFQKGVAKSSLLGFSVMSGLYTGNAGAISQNPKAVSNGITYDGVVRYQVYDTTGNNWELTSHGYLYKNGTLVSGGSQDAGTENTGCGLAYYGGKVYVARTGTLNYYDTNTLTWTTSWQTLNSASFHTMLVGQDNVLYICNNTTIASYNGTTWNASALTLPPNMFARTFTELGLYLYIGTVSDGGQGANILPWDRLSTNIVENIIRIEEDGVYQLLTKNNYIYALCGNKATLYSTVGTTATKLVSFADYIKDTANNNFITYKSTISSPTIHPQGIAINGDEILIGLPNNLFTSTSYPFGVWSYNTSTGAVNLMQTNSNNYVSSNQSAEICCIYKDYSVTNSIYFSWRLGISGSGGITSGNDLINYNSIKYHSNYEDYFETAFYQVGFTNNQRMLNKIDVKFSKLLQTGQGIQIKYRTNLTDSWTTLATVDYATYGAINSYEVSFGVSVNAIQFRIEFSGQNTTVSYSPELTQIAIY